MIASSKNCLSRIVSDKWERGRGIGRLKIFYETIHSWAYNICFGIYLFHLFDFLIITPNLLSLLRNQTFLKLCLPKICFFKNSIVCMGKILFYSPFTQLFKRLWIYKCSWEWVQWDKSHNFTLKWQNRKNRMRKLNEQTHHYIVK